MSEEEIIHYLKDIFLDNELNFKYGSRFNDKQAIQGILDLYNKEKEKNKKVINYIEKNKQKFKNLDFVYPEAVLNHFNKINNILT